MAWRTSIAKLTVVGDEEALTALELVEDEKALALQAEEKALALMEEEKA